MTFVILILAVYRLTLLFAYEEGPSHLFARLRTALGPKTGGLFDCFWCLSVWLAAFLSVFAASSAREWFLLTLASSGGAVLIEEFLGNRNGES